MNAQWVLVAMLGVVAVNAFASDVVAATGPGWSVLTIGALCAGVAGVIAAIATASVKIINALHANTEVQAQTKDILVTGQAAATAVSVVASAKMQEIHLLVNNRFLTALRLLVTVTKKEAERTGKNEDRLMAEHAEAELKDAEASALIVSRIQVGDADAERASVVAAEHTAALARAGTLPTPQEQLILAQETLVELTKKNAERTKSDVDTLLYRQAQDNLALSKRLQ